MIELLRIRMLLPRNTGLHRKWYRYAVSLKYSKMHVSKHPVVVSVSGPMIHVLGGRAVGPYVQRVPRLPSITFPSGGAPAEPWPCGHPLEPSPLGALPQNILIGCPPGILWPSRGSQGLDAIETAELPTLLQSGTHAAELLLEHAGQPNHEPLQLRRRDLRRASWDSLRRTNHHFIPP